jgi:hypothetical protein
MTGISNTKPYQPTENFCSELLGSYVKWTVSRETCLRWVRRRQGMANHSREDSKKIPQERRELHISVSANETYYTYRLHCISPGLRPNIIENSRNARSRFGIF